MARTNGKGLLAAIGQTGSATIRHGDCMDFLRTVGDEAAGLVIADPPYNIGYDGGMGWDSGRSDSEWLDWCMGWTAECARILQPGRMLVVWGTLGADCFLQYKLKVDSELGDKLLPQNEIVWEHNWGGRSSANFARKHDVAWCWSKAGADLQFDADAVRVERKLKVNIRTGEPYTKGTIPTCVWDIVNHTTSADHCGWHPTTKPPVMLQRMVRAWSRPGDLVVDPFLGSGSTAIAALREGRDCSGSELEGDYVSKMVDRIHALCPDSTIDVKE